MSLIYLIGSLKARPTLIEVEKELKFHGFDVFLDWLAPGEEADDKWKEYSQARGLTHKEALNSYAARHIVEFDKYHLDRADLAVLVMPAGKSGHLELGYMIGKGKPSYVLYPDGELDTRWEVMPLLSTGIAFSVEELVEMLSSGFSTKPGGLNYYDPGREAFLKWMAEPVTEEAPPGFAYMCETCGQTMAHPSQTEGCENFQCPGKDIK